MKIKKSFVNLLVMFVLLLGMLPVQHTQATPQADTWQVMASMPTARTLLGVVTASNGKIYAIGGQHGSTALATVEEYDPATNTWATKASMPTARQSVGVAAASNGKIYAIGGAVNNDPSSSLNTVEEYDPATNTWVARASMPTARPPGTVTAANNGKIYVIGGTNGSGILTTVEEYDPATNTWATRASMPTVRAAFGVAAASNGKIYAIGGNYSTTVEEYDPATDTWATKANMSIARSNFGIAAGNGKIYVIGGQDLGPAMAEYDPATDTWAMKANMLLGDRICAGAAEFNGKIYAIGGHTAAGPLATVEEYTPEEVMTYSISGQVTLSGSATGLAGVTVSAGGGFSALTDANGNYTIDAIPAGDYTLTPSKNGYTFSPSTRPVSVGPNAIGQNFSAIPSVSYYSISGRVTNAADSTAMEGVQILDGSGHTATTGSDGTYTLGGLAAGTYTISPTKSGYYFDPINRSVGIGPDASGQDFLGFANGSILLTADPGFNSIHISWEPASYATVTGYRVQRATPTAQDTYAVITTTTELDYFDSTGLIQDQNYCYKVDAMASGSVVASSSAACAIFGQVNLWIPDMYGVNGDDNAIVPINIRNATGLKIASTDIWLDYDPAVLTCTNVANTPMSIEFQWEANFSTPGLVKISTFASPPKAVMGDGSLFWLTFKVIGKAGDTSSVTLKPFVNGVGGSSIYTDPGDGLPIEVPLVLTSGTFYVESTGKLGDVTNDGTVNSADAYLALQISVGKVVPTFKQKYTADVNGDGTINSADVTMILYYAANGVWPLPPATMSAYRQSAGLTAPITIVSLDSISGNPGAIVITTLCVENLQDWAGGDFVITFDPRLVANVTNVTAAGLASTSPLQYRYSSDGSLKISIARSASISGTGALATITLKLTANAVVHTSPLVLAGVRFHDPYGRDFELSAIQGTINRQNGSVNVNFTVFLPTVKR